MVLQKDTTEAGAKHLRHIYDAWDKTQNAIGVYCDLSKAFNCVDHQTLLLKLNHYGIRDAALDVITFYLNQRVQTANKNNVKSSGFPLRMDVPQEFILLYINDLPFFVRNLCDIVLFADDTSLIFKVECNRPNYDDINSTLSLILCRFEVNNSLVLNAKKTKVK